jgi:cell wall-associated NlpC family hydrolase
VIDGKTIECKVVVFKAYFKRNSKSIDYEMDKTWHENDTMLILYKGESTRLTLKGLAQSAKVKWSSSDKTIAKVSKNGTVTAKGAGYCTISASFSGTSISYEVGVSAKTAVQAIRYAVKHYNSTYSQEKRMSTGYYDCSSYIWRSYQSAKDYLGSSSYAPTAADLAKWCKENGYVIYDGKANISKLLPGDLIFETGENNGRYKGIYHVDLYVGNNTTLTVARSKIWYGTVTDVVVARPCK